MVVIGIITVLIAILLPVLGKAREQANRVKCAANLRSMGQALIAYVQQYGYYPGTFTQDLALQPADAAIWPVRLRPFLGGAKEVFHCPSRDDRFRWTYDDPQPVVRASNLLGSFGYEPDEPVINSRVYFSYGYNGWGAAGDKGSVAGGTHKGLGFMVAHSGDAHWRNVVGGELPASRVRVPEDMIAIADSRGDGRFEWHIRGIKNSGNEQAWPGRVHSGGANVLFCDGHVTWYRQEDLLIDPSVDPPSAPSQWPKYRLWNNDHRNAYGR